MVKQFSFVKALHAGRMPDRLSLCARLADASEAHAERRTEIKPASGPRTQPQIFVAVMLPRGHADEIDKPQIARFLDLVRKSPGHKAHGNICFDPPNAPRRLTIRRRAMERCVDARQTAPGDAFTMLR